MPLQLRDHLHWCDSDGRVVFLDVGADRYFCLARDANDAFLRLAAATMRPGDPERLQGLVARGVLVETDRGEFIPPPPAIEPPTSDVLGTQSRPLALLPLIRALACESAAAWALRTKPFGDIIEARRATVSSATDKEVSPAAIARIAAASAAASLLTRRHDRCLVRALAVHSMCIRSGIGAKLVFGVVANPFAAHCWVQLGRAVVVGGYEQARLYTPILVAG